MYKIGIIGNGPEYFAEPEGTQEAIRRVTDLLGFQYGKDKVVFNVLGHTGVGLWTADIALEQGFKFHVFVPYPLDQTCEHWYEEQENLLRKCCNGAHSVTSCYPDSSHENKSYQSLIDESNFIVCFWVGRKQGGTYDAIRYALKTNKLVVSGENLKLITITDVLKKRERKI